MYKEMRASKILSKVVSENGGLKDGRRRTVGAEKFQRSQLQQFSCRSKWACLLPHPVSATIDRFDNPPGFAR